MVIVMTQTCEDSHSFMRKNERGKREVGFDTRKFYQGGIYDGTDHTEEMDWAERAKSIVDLGLAVGFETLEEAQAAIKAARDAEAAERTRVEQASAEAAE